MRRSRFRNRRGAPAPPAASLPRCVRSPPFSLPPRVQCPVPGGAARPGACREATWLGLKHQLCIDGDLNIVPNDDPGTFAWELPTEPEILPID